MGEGLEMVLQVVVASEGAIALVATVITVVVGSLEDEISWRLVHLVFQMLDEGLFVDKVSLAVHAAVLRHVFLGLHVLLARPRILKTLPTLLAAVMAPSVLVGTKVHGVVEEGLASLTRLHVRGPSMLIQVVRVGEGALADRAVEIVLQ